MIEMLKKIAAERQLRLFPRISDPFELIDNFSRCAKELNLTCRCDCGAFGTSHRLATFETTYVPIYLCAGVCKSCVKGFVLEHTGFAFERFVFKRTKTNAGLQPGIHEAFDRLEKRSGQNLVLQNILVEIFGIDAGGST